MTFFTFLTTVILAGIATTVSFFRKGGIYNPMEIKDFTNLSYMPPEGEKSPVDETFPEKAPSIPSPSQRANKATLDNMCLAIRDFEGMPGDANYLNNNPGNCKYHEGGYLPIYGKVTRSPAGFAIFPTKELGMLYLRNFIKTVVHNHPDLTLTEFVGGKGEWKGYAPASDDNPVEEYATFLRNRLAVDSAWRIKNLNLT